MSTRTKAIIADARSLADPQRAAGVARFFKTGPGEYGEGDAFLGLTMPQVRATLKAHPDLTLDDCVELLASKWHEVRMLGVLGMARMAKKGDAATRLAVRSAYIAHSDRVNNWDLVDVSVADAVGLSVVERGDLMTLEKLARSKSLWERRIAIVATFANLRAGDVAPTLRIAQLLLGDSHDLIHKATGWLLREVGKRDVAALEGFLEQHAATMPRTALRYAIERMPPATRQDWLARKSLRHR